MINFENVVAFRAAVVRCEMPAGAYEKAGSYEQAGTCEKVGPYEQAGSPLLAKHLTFEVNANG